jgi:hypothetical protein
MLADRRNIVLTGFDRRKNARLLRFQHFQISQFDIHGINRGLHESARFPTDAALQASG